MVDHQHVWAKEPPQGKQFSKRPSVDRRGDMLDVAHNSFWTSPEELKRLRLLREEDPEFENSSDWPMVVEWCSSCAITKEVKLVLPDQEEVPKVSCELSSGMKVKRKRGGGGSRLRRLLAHQLILSERWGLPLSRLFLANKEKTEAKSPKVAAKKVKVESVSSRPLKQVKQEVEEEEVKVTVKEEKEEESGLGKEVSSSGSTFFTLRSFPTVADPPSTQPLPCGPCLPPSPAVSPPLFTPPFFSPPWIPLHQTQQFGQMPAANWVICGGCQMWGTVVPFWAAHSV